MVVAVAPVPILPWFPRSAPCMPPMAAETIARTNARNSQYPPVVRMLFSRYGFGVAIPVEAETVPISVSPEMRTIENTDIPNVTRPAYIPILRVFAPVSLPASFPAKYRAIIDKITVQIPIPAPAPGPIRFVEAGFVADPKIAAPRTPNVTSIARNRNVPANIPVHENSLCGGTVGYSVY